MKRIAVIDYGGGNIRSVENALLCLGEHPHRAKDGDEFVSAEPDIVVLPGVGDGTYMMQQLHARSFSALLRDWMMDGKPLLGICVGAQVLLSETEESPYDRPFPCLDIFRGSCRSFASVLEKRRYKIPHMGWNEVCRTRRFSSHPLFRDIAADAPFYFVHSFYLDPIDEENIIATTDYGFHFSSIIGRGKIVGTQFHPEKSGRDGMKFLENFLCFAMEK